MYYNAYLTKINPLFLKKRELSATILRKKKRRRIEMQRRGKQRWFNVPQANFNSAQCRKLESQKP